MILIKFPLNVKTQFYGFFLLLLLYSGCKIQSNTSSKSDNNKTDLVKVSQTITDTLFNSNQIISLIHLKNSVDKKYSVGIGYDNKSLIKTSEFGIKNNAIAAVNGGFFDMTNGGSVSYLEHNDKVINYTKNPEQRWSKPDNLINGAIVLSKNGQVLIQSAKKDNYYEESNDESFVLITGPLLINNSQSVNLPDMKFTHKRHPRTCMCKTNDSVILLTIDGRQENAHGMNLIELQKYLQGLGCIDAINLDGGGSTTMWTKEKGIINNPSDKKGERPVANVILIK